MPSPPSQTGIPILLLKTRSTPHDAYESLFASPAYNASFIPVLWHRPNAPNVLHLRFLLRSNISTLYGGLIFTSQRAVEAFATIIEEGDEQLAEQGNLKELSIPLYVVGPATSRTLFSLRNTHLPGCPVLGEHTGNGDKLAHYMRQHYNALYSLPLLQSLPHPPPPNPSPKLPLLFLVGEQRRDIIPKTLMDETLPEGQRIQVDELVVYETAEMESFPRDFEEAVTVARAEAGVEGVVWVVVFSPTGCEAMLKGLGWLDEERRYKGRPGAGGLYVATIGPTTRDYLQKTFGFSPDVCAEKPSPEGVRDGIEKFMLERGVR